MANFLLIGTLLLTVFVCSFNTKEQEFTWDEKGYLFFCLCMGRFGNQMDHFLGGLSLARKLNRTLVLPPWRTYKNVPFTDYFKFESIAKYHRVILAEDFMKHLAPTHWPVGHRVGMCYNAPNRNDGCKMKEGNPFGSFWDGLGVDFDRTETHSCSYLNPDAWTERFPVEKYPVLALKGAPAKYPVATADRHLQKYFDWSDSIREEGQHYIDAHFGRKKFLGLHLRNGVDWNNACKHVHGLKQYMSSPQCLDPASDGNVTIEMCFPSTEEVLRSVKTVVENNKLHAIYVATDKSPLIEELTKELAEYNVTVYHHDPMIPQIDLYILGQSDVFIGNCVSSFTAFVTRERTVNDKVSLFWGTI